jgi:hypothetical protein
MLWVRMDGQRIGDNPTLIQQADFDKAACHADLDPKVEAQRSAAELDTIKSCMVQKGYALAPADQAEAARIQFAQWAATAAAQKAAEQAAAKRPITSKPKKPPHPKTTGGDALSPSLPRAPVDRGAQ